MGHPPWWQGKCKDNKSNLIFTRRAIPSIKSEHYSSTKPGLFANLDKSAPATIQTHSASLVLLLKKQRSKMDEIVTPNGPLMVTGSFDRGHRQAPGFEGGDRRLVGFEQRVVYPAGHPEQT